MPFRGNFEGFQPPELLQFLHHAQKTGTLKVYDEEETQWVGFSEGRLLYSFHERPLPRLEEIIRFRRLESEERALAALSRGRRWDNVLSQVLARRRRSAPAKASGEAPAGWLGARDGDEDFSQLQAGYRLGEYLVLTGRLKRRELEEVLEEQLDSERRIGEILVSRKMLSESQVAGAVREVEDLRSDFGPLYPLRKKLIEESLIDVEKFSAAQREAERSRRPLVEILAAEHHLPADELRRLIRDVLVEEICELYFWSEAAFEFLEGVAVEDARAKGAFPVVVAAGFDVPTLLLAAHSNADELERFGVPVPSNHSIFVREPAPQDAAEAPAKAAELPKEWRNVVHALDGRTSFAEVRRVLPGNRFGHFELLLELQTQGAIRSSSRLEAFKNGEDELKRGRYHKALALFRHAADAGGEEPPLSRIEDAIREARDKFSGVPSSSKRRRREIQAPGARRLHQRLAALRLVLLRAGLRLEAALIRSGLGKPLWALHVNAVQPVIGFFARGRPLLRFVALIVLQALLVWVTLASWNRGAGSRHAEAGGPSSEIDPAWVYSIPAPVEVAPAMREDRVVVASRDGLLRSLNLRLQRLEWQMAMGEFGDIAIPPALAKDGRVFAGTLRGRLAGVSNDGTRLWTRELLRLEGFEPALLYRGGQLRGLLVASRESALVLDPEDGRTVFQWRTGNRIGARPLADGDAAVVGSGDNHVYRLSWTRHDLEWDSEFADDVVQIASIEGAVVVACRDGRLAALEAVDGRRRWEQALPGAGALGIHGGPSRRAIVELEGGKVAMMDLQDGRVESIIQARPELAATRSCRLGNVYLLWDAEGVLHAAASPDAAIWRSRSAVGTVTGAAEQGEYFAVATREGNVVVLPWPAQVTALAEGRKPGS
jgi:hypothetical protein